MVSEQCMVMAKVMEKKECKDILFTDRTGEIHGEIPNALFTKEVAEMKGKVVKVTAAAVHGYIKVRAIAPAEKGDYVTADMYASIPEEILNKYKVEIRKMQSLVKKEPYRTLLEKCLTEEVLAKMAVMPASLSQHGQLQGGMLEAVAKVTKMVINVGSVYVLWGNGVETRNLDGDLIITAALLHNYGNFVFYTNEAPFQRTDIGINQGYVTTLQMSIRDIIIRENIPFSNEELARMMGVYNQVGGMKSPIAKSVCSEAALINGVYRAYSELNMYDHLIATKDNEEGYSYDAFHNRYIG